MGIHSFEPGVIKLGRLIQLLKQEDGDRVVAVGFAAPHGAREDYSELAFNPAEGVSIGFMLDNARGALGAEFVGYKGGTYTMTADTPCFIGKLGEPAVLLTERRIASMLSHFGAGAHVCTRCLGDGVDPDNDDAFPMKACTACKGQGLARAGVGADDPSPISIGRDLSREGRVLDAILYCPSCSEPHFDDDSRPTRCSLFEHVCRVCSFRWCVAPPCRGVVILPPSISDALQEVHDSARVKLDEVLARLRGDVSGG